jgi:hypothetical protein
MQIYIILLTILHGNLQKIRESHKQLIQTIFKLKNPT